ncbi:hypothetical protein ASD38_03215 [Caulobacter sp. Root487D2Y]|uniref:hypothetical protein n=1 Tax=Caulobacter sp. Root487D2Y TaxID=1736547 RepID=UPI0007132635|nr:hypothetical protein [Caulobacter sp. Root487D2Y]KQY35582.1 hypothetical protein ASD38_03215 [Caulobacter sp. Root487D2Y]
MKIAPIVLGVGGALLLVGAIGLGIWAGMPANPLATLGILVLSAGALTKLVYLVLFGLGIWIAILGATSLAKGRSGDPSLLSVLTLLPPGLGLLATLLTGLSIVRAMQNTHTSDLFVIAPSLAEALAPLGVGLLLGAVPAALKARLTSAAA